MITNTFAIISNSVEITIYTREVFRLITGICTNINSIFRDINILTNFSTLVENTIYIRADLTFVLGIWMEFHSIFEDTSKLNSTNSSSKYNKALPETFVVRVTIIVTSAIKILSNTSSINLEEHNTRLFVSMLDLWLKGIDLYLVVQEFLSFS